MGYLLGRGEGAELRAKQKSALDQIREHHKRKAEAEKDGETVKPQIGVYKDSKESSPEDKHKAMGDAAQPLTRSAIFALTSAKKRKPSDLEDGEMQSPKRAKIGEFSERALKPKPARAHLSPNISYKGTTKLAAGQKTSSYKGIAKPSTHPTKGAYTRGISSPGGPKKPSNTGPERPSTQKRPIRNTGSVNRGQHSKTLGPEQSLKRKAREEHAGAPDAKVHRAALDATVTPRRDFRKPSYKKLFEQKSEAEKSYDKKKLGEEKSPKAKAEEKEGEKYRSENISNDHPSGNKRKADDNTRGQAKKIKTREGLGERKLLPREGDWPKGLHNHGLACFANAVMQCLNNIPELVKFYRGKAKDTVKTCNLTEYQKKEFRHFPKAEDLRRKFEIRKAFRGAKSAIRVEAYLGELFERMDTAGSEIAFVSTIDFLYALGIFVNDDKGHPLDGEQQGDAWEFYCRLLHHLENEEVNSRDSHKEMTVMEKLLGSATVEVFSCSFCGHRHEGGQTPGLSVDIGLCPRVEEAIPLTHCLEAFTKDTTLKDYKCDDCGKSGGVTKATRIKQAAQYAVIKLTRTDSMGKTDTEVTFPTSELDLASLFARSDANESHCYEIIGVAHHFGDRFDEGHWYASKKVNGKWWFCTDGTVVPLKMEEDMAKPLLRRGCLFFLKKVEKSNGLLPSCCACSLHPAAL